MSYGTCAIPKLKVGQHVVYFEGKTRHDALVRVIFTEHGWPRVTLLMIGEGERGEMYRREIPHRSRHSNERGYYVLPDELENML